MKQQCISPKKVVQGNTIQVADYGKYQGVRQVTIAQYNKVSLKDNKHFYNIEAPFRILLPEHFNIPTFTDHPLPFRNQKQSKTPPKVSLESAVFKKRMKDLSLLADGMKRAKNIKQQSRYYFTQGILLHNDGQISKAIQYFQKFFKIGLGLRDSKSIQLALNALACAQMYLGQYQKAIEIHKKQVQVSDRTDHVLSIVNIGMCLQLMGKIKQAYQKYQQAFQCCDDDQRRKKALQLLIQRVENKIQNDRIFMTQNKQQKSPKKQIKNSLIKEESFKILKNISGGKEYSEAKFKFAITSAEEDIQNYLVSAVKYQNFT